MKKLMMAAFLLACTVSASAQKDVKSEMDTVLQGSKFVIELDSASYSNLINFVGSIPASVNKAGGLALTLIDGSQRNVSKYPMYALVPKKKK